MMATEGKAEGAPSRRAYLPSNCTVPTEVPHA